ncbi:MAG: c-type cytochrome [Gemmatimonadota bacterium]
MGSLLIGCQVEARPPSPPTAPPVAAVEPPADHPLRKEILRGHAILEATAESLPGHVGNALRCTSCHLDGGTTEVLGWKGAYARFPQYRSRGDAIQTIEDRVNDCLERSMNGKALLSDSPGMKSIVAYLAWLSKETPVTGGIAGGKITGAFDGLHPDTANGGKLFAAQCALCHGVNGEGTALATPVWGPRSFNIGAGMARSRTAAAFVHANMPRSAPGSLTAQQALDVAAYIDGKPRPDFAGKVNDWPRGDAPADTPYRTKGTP